ncbi:MAG: S9 family peptidase [Parvibaculaceae bacterium]
MPPAIPRAVRKAALSTVHGIERDDPYAWLRAANWQQVMREPAVLDAEIRTHLEAENAYTEAVLKPTEGLQRRLFEEMKGRIKEDDSTAPSPDGPWAYYISYVAGGEHPRYCRKPRSREGEDVVLIDGNREAEGLAFFRLAGLSHSPDHRYVAWGADDRGSELHRIRVRDTKTGSDLEDVLSDTTGAAVWAADSRTFFYGKLDDNHRPAEIYRHVLGTPQSDDVLVYREPDPGFFAGVGKTLSGRYIVIDSHDHETSEQYVIDARDPASPMRTIWPRRKGVEFSLDHQGDRFLFLTNEGGAEDFRITWAPVDAPEHANWREIVPHVPGRLILGMEAFRDFLVRLERENGLPRIVVRERESGAEHSIAFDEEAYSLGLGEAHEYDTTTLRFTYSSMTTPGEVFDYDMRTRARTLVKVQEVPSGHDPANYVTRRILALAADGETVPVSLLYRRDTPLDGSAPLWLYGYGAYGIAIPAAFNTNILSLADRGFVYAIAHVRGGKEKGYRWYREGKREKKTNTFTDFIAAARHLVAERYTSQGAIVAQGGSAGGMLMGAVANLAPELFRAVVAEVPFVDVLATMLDDSLPLTPPEWPEWGNPIASPEDFRAIAAYSPYDNVRTQAYPNILAVAGLTDPRVTYWEPAKWVARLRDHNTADTLVLLKTQMGAGHAGSPGRFDRLKEVAFVYAFGLMVTGRV